MIPQLLTDLSNRMGLALVIGEQTSGIDFEVDGKYRIALDANPDAASLVLDCALSGQRISEGEALNLLRYNLAGIRRDGILLACDSKDGTLHLVKRLDLTPASDAEGVAKALESLLDAADRWSTRLENESDGLSSGLISEMSRFA